MPYASDLHGVYRLVNDVTNQCYVGSSRRVRKRISEHLRLLRLDAHPNQRLQESFNRFGEASFSWDVEVTCEDPSDLASVEEAFLSGEASFSTPVYFNISHTAKAPMRGRRHTEETKSKISASKLQNNSYLQDPIYRQKLSLAQNKRLFSDKNFVERVRFLVDNPDLTYAERGRRLGMGTSAARKLALKYSHLRGKL